MADDNLIFTEKVRHPSPSDGNEEWIDVQEVRETNNIKYIRQPNAFTVGTITGTLGNYSFSNGSGNIVSGNYSHAEGEHTQATATAAHAEGWGAIASGARSHAEGHATRASEVCSHAEGQQTHAFGYSSHTEGISTTASGAYSHAEGWGTQTITAAAHAEGRATIASGRYSHAEGYSTTASGECSHAGGFGTIASGDDQTAIGKYNIEDTNDEYALIIGNGEDEDNRLNALTIDWDGNVDAAGNIKATGNLSFGSESSPGPHLTLSANSTDVYLLLKDDPNGDPVHQWRFNSATGNIAQRKYSDGSYGSWYTPNIKGGTVTIAAGIPGNGMTTTAVSFDRTFSATPNVQVTLKNPSLIALRYLNIGVSSVTTTGCTLNIYNNGASVVPIAYIDWLAAVTV